METHIEKMENIFEILNEKQTIKFLELLHQAEKEYNEYQKKISNIIAFFERMEYELDYDCENDRKNCDKYEKISKILDKIKTLTNNDLSPIFIITEALKITDTDL